MFYRIALADPLDTEAGRSLALEGLFTAGEVEQIRERYYGRRDTTELILAKPACGDCDDCQFAEMCSR